MSYQNVRRVPPPTAPKPYSQNVSYKPVNPNVPGYGHVQSSQISEEVSAYPPPPPPDSFSKGYSYAPEDELPPPPPPAPPQAYSGVDQNNYSNVYSGEARYARNDDYRPPDYDSVSSQSPRSSMNDSPASYSGDNNYANIQINIAPPAPTDSSYNSKLDSPSDHYVQMSPRRGAPSQGNHQRPGSGDRAVPGPMVPPSGKHQTHSTAQMASPLNPQHYGSQQASSLPPQPYSVPAAQGANKEAEVDALTEMLVKNMTSAQEDDNFWGMCGRCGTTVSGSTNACSALDNVYHIGCFTCCGCSAPLQGKSFFAMETKPYCEVCYVGSLERCSVCSKPITDRLLRATGKPYHPDCFTCVVCGKSLDGIPFTVDATNQIHCIEDFHRKFAPRCCVCQKPIMPDPGRDETVRIVALDKSFHVGCYRCEDCDTQLSSEAEGRGCYPLDDHILCKNCNAKRIQALTTKMSTEL